MILMSRTRLSRGLLHKVTVTVLKMYCKTEGWYIEERERANKRKSTPRQGMTSTPNLIVIYYSKISSKPEFKIKYKQCTKLVLS